MRYIVLVLIILNFCYTPADANVIELAAATDSERLTYFASSIDMKSEGDANALKNFITLSSKIGFNALDKRKSMHGYRVSPLTFTPTLAYDDNANGGNRSSRISFSNGLILNFPETSLATSDVLAGIQAGTGVRSFYGRGKYFDFNASLGKSWGIKTHLAQTSWVGSACSRNHVIGWTFIDFCARQSGELKSLGNTRESRAELIFDRLIAIEEMPWETRAIAFRQNSSGEWNDGIGFQALGVLRPNVSLAMSLDAEINSEAHRYQKYDASVKLNFKTHGRQFSVRVSQSLTANAKLLGESFEVASTSISAGMPIGAVGNVNLTLEHKSSEISAFGGTSMGLSFDFSSMKFRHFLK